LLKTSNKPLESSFSVIHAVPVEHGKWPEKLNLPKARCKACLTAGRFATAAKKRKILGELDINSIAVEQGGNGIQMRKKKTPLTHFGCPLCQVHLCQKYICWQEHIILASQTTPEQPIVII
jgi:hypothetical protein